MKSLRQRFFGALRIGQGYEAASTVARWARHYKVSSGSPDGEIVNDLEIIRTRSRDQYKNTGFGRGPIETFTQSVIGRGLRLQSIPDRNYIAGVMGWEKTEADEFLGSFVETYERRFRLWAESKESDIQGKNNFYENTKLAYKSIKLSGDVFVTTSLIKNNQTPFRLKIGLIEADQVANPFGVSESRLLRAGIETNEFGKPLGYWVNQNQEVYPFEYKFIPIYGKFSGRRLITHLFRADRPGQSRGIPLLAPITRYIKTAHDYKQSEAGAAFAASLYSVFITSSRDNVANTGIVPSKKQTEEEKKKQGIDFNLAPGAIIQLLPGESIEGFNPNRPNSNFGPFLKEIAKEVGMAINMPYEILLKEFNSSYTASRASMNYYEKTIDIDRAWMGIDHCQYVSGEFLDDEVAAGNILAPGYFDSFDLRKAYQKSNWVSDSVGQIDPVKETKAAIDRVNNQLSTKSQETARFSGNEYLDNLETLKREKDERIRLGLEETKVQEVK